MSLRPVETDENNDSAEPTNGAGRRGRATTRRSGGLALLAALAAILLAGCGGSKAPAVANLTTRSTAATTPSASGGNGGNGGGASSGSQPSQTQPQQAALKYARCMRRNGVPNFPDPNGGGGFTFNPANPAAGVDPSSPAFKAAQAKCQKDIGGGLAAGTQTHPSPQWLAKMVKAARCMRRHGVPNFPDPTTTIPSPNSLGGYVQISNIDGVIFVFPAATIDTQSPAFTRAAQTCGFPLHNH